MAVELVDLVVLVVVEQDLHLTPTVMVLVQVHLAKVTLVVLVQMVVLHTVRVVVVVVNQL
jgi:hypothetical protein